MAPGRDDPEPLGFGNCGSPVGTVCAYLEHGSARVCWPCTQRTITRPTDPRCETCEHPLQSAGASCDTWLCHDPTRHFRTVHAVGYAPQHSELYRVLLRYKTRHGWAVILARILVGWLDDDWPDSWSRWDLITSMPHAEGEHGRDYTPGHKILRLATDEDPIYPFDTHRPAAIIKTHETPSVTGRPARERERLAATEIYPALQVPDRERVEGKKVLVIDDFFTTGHSINQVARKLKESGAVSVDVLVFGRFLMGWAQELR